jgi:Ca2+-transporting ATPase
LVPGDLVYFEAGDRIPADIRLIEANGLSLDESSLTGETKPIFKHSASLVPNQIDLAHIHPSWYIQVTDTSTLSIPKFPISERKNIAFMGTLVCTGNGRGVVIATGHDSELGQICKLMKEVVFIDFLN